MKKALVIGVILLFLGVGFQPALANEVSITNTSDNEDCGCQEILDVNSNSPICNGLDNFLDSLSVLFLSLEDKMENLSEDSVLYKIYYLYQWSILNFSLTIILIGIFFNCWNWWPEPP